MPDDVYYDANDDRIERPILWGGITVPFGTQINTEPIPNAGRITQETLRMAYEVLNTPIGAYGPNVPPIPYNRDNGEFIIMDDVTLDEEEPYDEEEPLEDDPEPEEDEEEGAAPRPGRIQRVFDDTGRVRPVPHEMKAETLQQLSIGHYFPYTTNVLTYLDIDPAKIPRRAFGIEIEVHASQAIIAYDEAYKEYLVLRDGWLAKEATSIPCGMLVKHYTGEQLIAERARRLRMNAPQLPVKHNTCLICAYADPDPGRENKYYLEDDAGLPTLKAALKTLNEQTPKAPILPKGADGARREFIAHLANRLTGFIAKRDGSLDETYGVEIVSVPLRIDDAREWLQELGRCCVDRAACVPTMHYGMHVHVNRQAFMGQAHVMRFYHALNARAQDAQLLGFIGAERQYANLHGDTGRGTDPWAKVYRTGFKKLLVSGVRRGDHHDAVSLQPKNTVEVRIFQSSVNYTVTCGNLEFVAALLEYTTPGADGGSIVRFNFNTFFRWVMERQYKNFPFLYERLLVLVAQGKITDPRVPATKQRIERKKKERVQPFVS